MSTGGSLAPDEGSLSHVISRSGGGKHAWENVVIPHVVGLDVACHMNI